MKLSFNNILAEFSEKGAYLKGLYINDISIIRESPDSISTHGGSAVLFPYANRVKNAEYEYDSIKYTLPKNDNGNSIHGLIRDEMFEYGSGKNYIEFFKNFKNEAYPGEAFIKIRYEIKNNEFLTKFSVKSLNKDIPVEIGFHPYFNIYGTPEMRVENKAYKLEYKDNHFPDGNSSITDLNSLDLLKTELDNTFFVKDNILLKDDKHSIIIKRLNMDYLVIYNGKYAGNDSIAIEPMTGAPDAFNNNIGLINLKKNEILDCGYSIELV